MALVQAGDISLEYFEKGDGDPTVVLIHGASSSARIWHVVQEKLAAAGMRTIALSMRGAGASDHTPDEADYNPAGYARDIAAALKALEIRKCVLVGHSLGVSNVLNFAADNAEGYDVQALVLMAGGAGGGRAEPTTEQIDALRKRVKLPDPATAEKRKEAWLPIHLGLPEDVRDKLWNDIQNNPLERLLGQGLGARKDMTEFLGSIEFPVLIVSGDADSVVPLEMSLQMYAKLPADKRHLHVIHGIDHFPNAQIPDRIAAVYQRFVRSTVM